MNDIIGLDYKGVLFVEVYPNYIYLVCMYVCMYVYVYMLCSYDKLSMYTKS